MSQADDNPTIEDVQDALDRVKSANAATVGDVVLALGSASFLPLLLLISLVVVTPLSGIPGLSGTCGIIIALVAGQLVYGRETLWLPDFILRREVPDKRLDRALAQIRRPLNWMQDHTRERLVFLVNGPARRVLLSICMLSGLMMPFLEVMPVTSSMMAGAIAILSSSIIGRDGVLTIAGLVSLGLALTVLSLLLTGALSLL